MYYPGIHRVPASSKIGADQLYSSDTLHIPYFFYSFYNRELKARYTPLNYNPDSVFQHYLNALEHLPIKFHQDTLRFIELSHKEYMNKEWSKKENIDEFMAKHDIVLNDRNVIIPLIQIYTSGLDLVAGGLYSSSNAGIHHVNRLFVCQLIIKNNRLSFRECAYNLESTLLDHKEPYGYQIEQHHWDSVVQMGFKEYISRMK